MVPVLSRDMGRVEDLDRAIETLTNVSGSVQRYWCPVDRLPVPLRDFIEDRVSAAEIDYVELHCGPWSD